MHHSSLAFTVITTINRLAVWHLRQMDKIHLSADCKPLSKTHRTSQAVAVDTVYSACFSDCLMFEMLKIPENPLSLLSTGSISSNVTCC